LFCLIWHGGGVHPPLVRQDGNNSPINPGKRHIKRHVGGSLLQIKREEEPLHIFLKRMAALTPPKPAEIERAIFTFFSLDSLGT
jgi:hypothetical protein